MRGKFSVLERYYNDAMSQVEELKSASSHTTPPALATTTEDPYDFDIISSLSDQISQLEERLGSCKCIPFQYNLGPCHCKYPLPLSTFFSSKRKKILVHAHLMLAN